MEKLFLIGGGLFVAAGLYTWWLSQNRPLYEPDNTHWAALGGVAIIQVAYLALCWVGPVPFFGDLPVEASWSHITFCWIAFFWVWVWRRHDKNVQRAKRQAGE